MSEPSVPATIEVSAARLWRQAGFGALHAVEPLPGGRNNRVYRVIGRSSTGILKHYHQSPGAAHDRFASEAAWYQFCEPLGISHLPRLCAIDDQARTALFQEIPGRKLMSGEVTHDHVRQAIQFFTDINTHREHPQAATVPLAADACFSVADHCQRIEQRLERLKSTPADDCLSVELHAWLDADFADIHRQITNSIHKELSADEWHRVLNPSERCLSPSDFGFHNAIVEESGQVCFLDFEYAGWDDPAKMVCDFYWQVDVPVPRETMPLWDAALIPFGSMASRRRRALFPLFGLKWCLIVLNEFLRDGADRRQFAGHTPDIDRRHRQFTLAQSVLDDIQRVVVVQ